MLHKPDGKRLKDLLLFTLIMGGALGVSMMLSRVNNDNNPFAMAVFILAVALIARVTDGYWWGVAASIVGTFCVNYFFTYPFWSFAINYPGYPLTMAVMLIVSVLVSALTTQLKRQEQLRLEIEREKMHANLLRAIAHDIRTPLASILGASSALSEQELPVEDRRALVLGIHRDAQWLVRVTENLLSVTRFSGGEMSLKKTDEILEEIVGSAILKYRRTPGALPVTVEGPDEIIVVPADGTLVEQVLINLFDNVSAHARGATRIWLTIVHGEGRITLCVEDDGESLPGAVISHMLDGAPKRDGGERPDDRRNMGIGLSVCGAIVRAHGGEMSAEKSRHGGLAVSFWLPCGEEAYGQQDEDPDR